MSLPEKDPKKSSSMTSDVNQGQAGWRLSSSSNKTRKNINNFYATYGTGSRHGKKQPSNIAQAKTISCNNNIEGNDVKTDTESAKTSSLKLREMGIPQSPELKDTLSEQNPEFSELETKNPEVNKKVSHEVKPELVLPRTTSSSDQRIKKNSPPAAAGKATVQKRSTSMVDLSHVEKRVAIETNKKPQLCPKPLPKPKSMRSQGSSSSIGSVEQTEDQKIESKSDEDTGSAKTFSLKLREMHHIDLSGIPQSPELKDTLSEQNSEVNKKVSHEVKPELVLRRTTSSSDQRIKKNSSQADAGKATVQKRSTSMVDLSRVEKRVAIETNKKPQVCPKPLPKPKGMRSQGSSSSIGSVEQTEDQKSKSDEVIDSVITKEHKLEEEQTIVEKFYSQLSPEIQFLPSSTSPTPSKITDPTEQQQNSESDFSRDDLKFNCKVDPDKMQFIMNGEHYEELTKKLRGCNAEIEWEYGSELANIWTKVDSEYNKKWSAVCQTTIYEFLGQFEKFFMPFESILSSVIKESLPRFVEALPKGKAFCKVPDDQGDNIIVICLESDRNIVSEVVKKEMEIIKNDEIRKTYKKEIVIIKNNEEVLLLEKMQFVEEMRKKYSELKISLCKEKQELYIEGPQEQLTNFKIQYSQLMSSITGRNLTLSSAKLGEILRKEQGRKYIKNKLDQDKISAIILTRKNNDVKIVAANSTACRDAEDCFLDLFKEDKITFQAQDSFIFQDEKFKILLKDLQKSQLVDICTDLQGNKIILQGIVDTVMDAKKKLEELVKTECVRDQEYPISQGLFRLLNDHHPDLKKNVETELKQSRVLITIDSTNNVINMTGTQDGLRKCKDYIDKHVNQFVDKTIRYSFPGLANLLLGSKGERNLKMIEMEKKVVIETSMGVKDGVKDTRREEVDVIWREEKEANELRDVAEQSPENSPGHVFENRVFNTTAGIKFSWKYGHIQNEVADALVNSATSDLNDRRTSIMKALSSAGGPTFDQVCQPYTDIQPGNIVTTTGGNLQCKYVIHAVCCDWDNGEKDAEQILRNLIQKVLAECVRLQLTSVAIPVIGAGKRGFPETLTSKIYVEELEQFKTPGFLKEVRIIIFKSRKPTIKRNETHSPIHHPSHSSIFSYPRSVTFGRVRVFLHQGDITQQSTAVDAIINLLNPSLELKYGGGVSEAILNAGGQVVQQEINSAPKLNSVIITSAGNIQNARYILHFLPPSTDTKGLQSSIEECFKQVKSSGFHSVSISAIGTAYFNLTAEYSASLIVNAAKNFFATNYQLDVNIVVFEEEMIPYFEVVMATHSNVSTRPADPQPDQNPTPLNKKRPPKSKSGRGQHILKTGTAKEDVVLHVFARSQQDLDLCIKDVNNFVEEHTTTKEIKQKNVFNVCEKLWPKMEKLARDHDVSISCSKSSSTVEIQGLLRNVSDCKDLIVMDLEKEQKSAQEEFISKTVQWYYYHGTEAVPYARELNILVETAYMANKEKINIRRDSISRKFDLKAKTERNSQTDEILTISRKQTGESDDISIPSHWAHQPPSQVVQLVSLQSSSEEYQQVLNHFNASIETDTQIIRIERVQNPGLYKAYLVKKQSMNGADNEKQLFHGTNKENITPINANNFSRSFAGINGVMYGNGVYFARDASYSSGYSVPDRSGCCYMYVARVLIGEYTIGTKGMKAPSSKEDPNNPGLLYDSLVDNTSHPTIFVIFLDHQCYPEYLITFRKKNI